MGITKIAATVTNLGGDKRVSGEFLVDTGAAYTVVPLTMAKKLGLKADRTQGFTLADATLVKRKLRPMRLMLA